jgi:large subunit ribosomal protein L25
MKTFQVSGTIRQKVGKKATNAVRNSGDIPCVLYGGKENIHFQVVASDVRKLIYTPEIFLVELTIDGVKHSTIMKELQFHPVSEKVLHLDFYEITDGKPVEIAVPVRLEGLAEGVKSGGKLQQNLRLIKVKGLVNDIPEQLKINVDNLGLGKTIQVSELSFPNLELTTPKTAIVATVNATRAVKK